MSPCVKIILFSTLLVHVSCAVSTDTGSLGDVLKSIETRGTVDQSVQICGEGTELKSGVHACWNCQSVGNKDSDRREQDKRKFPAFTVSSHAKRYYPKNGVIKYDIVNSNTNNGFDTTTGKFKATIRGRYLFSTSVRAQYKLFCHPGIYKNGRSVVYAASGNDPNWYGSSGSVSAILDLNVNDEVYIADTHDQGGKYDYASFTGAMLFAL